MAARPTVTVMSAAVNDDGAVSATDNTVVMPSILLAPIRPDVVQAIHKDMAKNNRQAYAVSWMAGMQTPGHSWGTGRAVSRIPRVPGGGTHRAGQAAFGNMCRGGHMFSPNRVWRKWNFKVNKNQRRFALASALAASALPSLVMALGHRIESVAEIPLVVSDEIQSTQKTAVAVKLLKALEAHDDVQKVKDSKKVRRGKGKMRNRRYTMRNSPLIIYAKDDGLTKAFRNIPGVELAEVTRLGLLDLAPGGHLGRFCIWSESAFAALDGLYGTDSTPSVYKQNNNKPYHLPRSCMTNSDLVRIINSDEVQSAINAPKTNDEVLHGRKKNPLKRFDEMVKLNPYASVVKRAEILSHAKKGKALKKRKNQSGGEGATGGIAKVQKTFYNSMIDEPLDPVSDEEEAAEEVAEEEEAAAGGAAAPAEEAALDDY